MRYAPTAEHGCQNSGNEGPSLNAVSKKDGLINEAPWAPTYELRDEKFSLWAEYYARCQALKEAVASNKLRGTFLDNITLSNICMVSTINFKTLPWSIREFVVAGAASMLMMSRKELT